MAPWSPALCTRCHSMKLQRRGRQSRPREILEWLSLNHAIPNLSYRLLDFGLGPFDWLPSTHALRYVEPVELPSAENDGLSSMQISLIWIVIPPAHLIHDFDLRYRLEG